MSQHLVIDPIYLSVSDFINPTVGFLKEIYRIRIHGSCPQTFMFGAKMCATKEIFPDRVTKCASNWSTGINIDRNSAILGCIFEGIERYCSAVVPNESLLWFSEQELLDKDRECMQSDTFDYFDKQQYSNRNFSFKKWEPNSKIRWSPALSLSDNRVFLIPSQFVYVPYNYISDEPAFFSNNSNGLACHKTLHKAIYAGLCEIIERDAFMIYWHNMLAFPKIRTDSLYGMDEKIDALLNRIYDIPNLELIVKNITTDIGIPTVLCIILNKKDKESAAAAFSAATDLNPVCALRKALNELLGTYSFTHTFALTPFYVPHATRELPTFSVVYCWS